MISKLGLALILLLLLALLLLALELLYVICYRRKFRRATSPPQDSHHLGLDGAPATKELVLYFLFHNNQASGIPPPSAAADPPIPEKEAEKRDVEAACKDADAREVVLRVVNEEEGERGAAEPPNPLPVVTPCGSPRFYTPVASPSREAAEVERRRAAQPGGFATGGICNSSAEMALELITT